MGMEQEIKFGLQECAKCEYKLRCEQCVYNGKDMEFEKNQTRKETAEKILNEIYNFVPSEEMSNIEIKETSLDDVTKAVRFLAQAYLDKAQELAEHYGVEINGGI